MKNNKKLFWILLLITLAVWLFYSEQNPISSLETNPPVAVASAVENDAKTVPTIPQTTTQSELSGSQTDFDYLPKSENNRKGQLLSYKGFTISFINDLRTAEWVVYQFTKEKLLSDVATRTNDFRPDPRTTSAHPNDYLKSGYDRGHLCPSEDMEYDKECMSESFFMTNITPQVPDFNRGIWKALENHVRIWTEENETLYIVAGPVFTDNMETIGNNKIPVPKYFYKIILDYQQPEYKMIAFLFPNEKSDRPLLDFRVSVDSVEKLTGIDFFPALPDNIETKFEDENFNEPLFSKLSDKPRKKKK